MIEIEIMKLPDKQIRIVSVKALHKNELPDEYMDGAPRVHISGIGIMFVANELYSSPVRTLYPGKQMSLSSFNSVMKTIRAAGNRLHEINRRHGNRDTAPAPKTHVIKV